MRYYNRKVRIEAEFSDRHICIQISDEGPGFEPKDVGDPREAENLRRVSGRGLLLIRTFMDQVVHNSVGNQITMTKLREREWGAGIWGLWLECRFDSLREIDFNFLVLRS